MALDRLLRMRSVCRLLGVPASQVRAWIEAGQFPRPVELPGRRKRWSSLQVTAWMQRLACTNSPAHVALTVIQQPRQEPTPATGDGGPVDLSGLPELAREILQALAESGDWMNGVDLAASISADVDHTSGSFRRVCAQLRDHDPPLIQSSRQLGYALTEAGRLALLAGRTLDGPWTDPGRTLDGPPVREDFSPGK